MYQGLKLQQLRYALAVLDDGGFKAAAKRLHRSQPALSLGVRELEDGLGAPIFERQGAGGLTPFGEICIPRFRELLGTHDRILKDLDDVVNQRSGRVEVVAAPSVARRYMPSVLNQFLRRYPSLEIVLHDGPADVVADMVRTGEVEFGVSALWGEADDLDFAPLLEDEVGVVCHHTHPLADANTLQWQDLIGQAMIRNGTSRLLEGTPAEDLLPDSRIYISEMISIVAMLETGTAYTTLPRLAFQDSVSTLRFIPLKNPTVKREIGIITRQGVTASPAAQVVVEVLTSAIAVSPGA